MYFVSDGLHLNLLKYFVHEIIFNIYYIIVYFIFNIFLFLWTYDTNIYIQNILVWRSCEILSDTSIKLYNLYFQNLLILKKL